MQWEYVRTLQHIKMAACMKSHKAWKIREAQVEGPLQGQAKPNSISNKYSSQIFMVEAYLCDKRIAMP